MSGYKDMAGKEITVGSLLAMPFAKHSSGFLRVGRVIELIPEKQSQWGGTTPEKLRVEWLMHSEYKPPRTSIVEKFENALALPLDFPVEEQFDEDGSTD